MATTDGTLSTLIRAHASLVACTLGAGLCLSGCAPQQTFPPTTGRAVFDASVPPVPEIMAAAIKGAHAKSSVADEPIVYNLPPGVLKETWKKVDSMLPESARPAYPNDTNIISVEQIRMSGSLGEVDVLVPKGNFYQLLTLHMEGAIFDPWKVKFVQPWTIRSEPPTCNNPYAADPPIPAAPAAG